MSQHQSLLNSLFQLVEESFAAFSGVSPGQVGHSPAASNPGRCTGSKLSSVRISPISRDSGVREHTIRADKER